MDYVKKGLHNTFNSIKKKKMLFAVLLALQILLVVSCSILGIYYLVKIVEETKDFIEPLEKANYDSQQIEEGKPFTPDYTDIFNSYNSMLKNVAFFTGGLLILYLTLNGSLWLLSHKMLQDEENKLNFKKAASFFLKIWAAFFLLFVPFAVLSYFGLLYYLRLTGSFTQLLGAMKILLMVKGALFYFLLVAFASATAASWKNYAKKALDLSILQFCKTFPLFLLMIAALIVPFSGLYAAIEYTESMILLLILGLLSLIMIVIARLFWITTMQEIEHETSHH